MKPLTDTASGIIQLSIERTLCHGQGRFSSVDVVLAMLEFPDSVAGLTLNENGVDRLPEALVGHRDNCCDLSVEQLHLVAEQQSRLCRSSFVGAEHLLLAICTSKSLVIARVLDAREKSLRENLCRSTLETIGRRWKVWRRYHLESF